MYPFNFCAVSLYMILASSSSVSRELEKDEALLFYNQETKNVNYTISKVSHVAHVGVNQTFIQRHRRNAQGNNFCLPTQLMNTIVKLQQYFTVNVLYTLNVIKFFFQNHTTIKISSKF